MTGGEQQRDFVYVEDIVRGLLSAMAAPDVEGRALDLGTGTLARVLDVVQRIWDLTETRGRILAGALPYRPGEVPAIPADVQRTRLLTGWEPIVSLDQGLALTIQSLCASGPCKGFGDLQDGEMTSRAFPMSEDDHAG